MKRMVLLAGLAFALLTATAQDSPYIVKTKGVKKTVKKAKEDAAALEEENEATDFMGRNFRFYSMCDWKEGMRFMVIPEKYDLLVTTFRDATNDKGVNNGMLRHKIMIYKGHEDMPNAITMNCPTEHLTNIAMARWVFQHWPIWVMWTRLASCLLARHC